jgi:hypothetical protein
LVVIPKGGPGFGPEPNVIFTTGSPRLPWHNCANILSGNIKWSNTGRINILKNFLIIKRLPRVCMAN